MAEFVGDDECFAESGQRAVEREFLMPSKPAGFILTWNPNLQPLNLAAEGDVLGRGGAIPGRWAVGQRTGGVRPGDDLWLFRTGPAGTDPGIVRRARAAGEVFQAAHWSSDRAAAGASTNYVLLEWVAQVPDGRALSRATLIREAPGAPWANLQASGVGLDSRTALVVREAWEKHLASFRAAPAVDDAAADDPEESWSPEEREITARPAAQAFVLQYLSEHPVGYTADLLRVAKERGVTGDVMLALYKMQRDGELIRGAGPPVRWSLAGPSRAAPVGVTARSTQPSAQPALEPASATSAREVVEMYLAWASVSWSEPQTRAALQGPNVQRMTVFSRDELTQSLAALDPLRDVDHWNAWHASATRHRSLSIQL